MEPMDSWGKMKEQKLLLPETEFIALCRNLYTGWENFLADKLRLREDQSLVLEVLTALATPRAQEILLKCLEDREEAVQLAAAEALKKMPPDRILRPLAAAMLRQSQGAAKAGEVLAALGPKGLEQLWQLWFEEGAAESLKTQVLLLLAEQADPRCENLAFLALLSQDEELVRAGLKAVEMWSFRDLWGNVACCLSSESWRVRAKACQVLAEMGIREALPALEQGGPDQDSWVEEERRRAIEKLQKR
ncbi:MAG: hypothetical protein VB085_02605 [Peptococcaceae bacterium]|nr:hypothetical protein [Peptococcaceae bacterium]